MLHRIALRPGFGFYLVRIFALPTKQHPRFSPLVIHQSPPLKDIDKDHRVSAISNIGNKLLQPDIFFSDQGSFF
jgi:hypothetical protein